MRIVLAVQFAAISPMKHLLFTLTLLVGTALSTMAALRPALVFQDHMVLQREMAVPVWGWAEPGADVKVTFAGQEKSSKSDDKGYWKVVLDPLKTSAEGQPLQISSGSETLTLKDVLVGEVWVCSGQSNMARTLKNDAFEYPRFNDYAKDAEFPTVRVIRIATHASDAPLGEFDGAVNKETKWQVLNSNSAMEVMSLAFFFAKDLNKKLGVPIGLVQVAVAGTPQTSWLAREILEEAAAKFEGSPSYETVFARAQENLGKGKETFKDWEGFKAAEAAWRANPTGRWPGTTLAVPDYPSVLYNAMIHPLAPLAFRGVIWHQGEGGPAARYRERLQAQVADWRKLFGHDFHFIWGSMTRFTSVPPPLGADQQSFRGAVDEEFLLASRDFGPDGKATLVGFFDLGNFGTHWARKEEGGLRMAGAALATVYGKPETIFTGPELVEAKIEGAAVRAKFRYVGGGLIHEPSLDGISGFLIEEKGASPELRWADVKVEGDTVLLSHPDVKKPTNAYYAWHSNPHETLFNKEGYPAFPFRMVPRSYSARGTAGPPLVEMLNPPEKAFVNVSHVRRHGYIFSPVQLKASGTVTVRAALPREWKGATVTSQGKPVETGELKTNAEGWRYFEFVVPFNGPDIIVADSANPPDFSGVERF